MKNKRLLVILLTVAVILLIPLIAMQFTNEVNWTFFDFLIMGLLLTGTGLLIDIVFKKVRIIKYRIVFVLIVIFAFLFIWAELAVGIIGTPFAGS